MNPPSGQAPGQTPANGQELPPRPQPPRDSDCCGSDCPLCVFTLYELERWKEQVEAIRSGATGNG